MSRKLLLIYDPRQPENVNNYIQGIRKTIEEYKRLFNSNEAGCWEEYEIECMPLNLAGIDETNWLDDKIRELNSGKFDYSIIVYAGHGGIEDDVELVELPSGQCYPITNLLYGLADENRGNIKRTVIIDACRVFAQRQPQQVSEELNEDIANTLNRTQCKDYFNSLIDHMEPHIELVHSTAQGQYAQGIRLMDGTFGGFVFSNALFKVIESNVTDWDNSVIGLIPQQDYKTNGEIVSRLSVLMTHFNQVPQIASYHPDGTVEASVSTLPFYAVRRINL